MKKILAACALTAMSQMSFAAPVAVDLSSWQEEAAIGGNGHWSLTGSNDTVVQTNNGEPTIFYKDGSNAQGTALSGTIEVGHNWDDDFVGFVLGYQTGEFTSNNADYWLVDWKQADQSGAPRGLAISHVTGAYQTTGSLGSDFWDHSGVVSEKQRAENLGNVGWVDGTEYLFDLVFTQDLIQVYVDGVLEINLTALAAGVTSFTDGAFGFYNFSQQDVRYAGIEQQQLNPVPVPAAAWLFGTALLGFAGWQRKRNKKA